MTKLVLHPTQSAQWQALVNDAESACAQPLHEDLESYLVFLLMRFLEKPEVVKNVLGLEFLESLQQPDNEQLREVGDKCLLFSGLFPQHAEHRRVKISYFVDLGRNAYANLSTRLHEDSAGLYSSLCEGFVSMMDVLQIVRSWADKQDSLLAIQAEELYRETGGQYALEILRRHTKGTVIFNNGVKLIH